MIVTNFCLVKLKKINFQYQNDFSLRSCRFYWFPFSQIFIKKNKKVVGIDSINNYYDVSLKKKRLQYLKKIGKKNFIFIKSDISNKINLEKIFKKYKIIFVINLAKQK